MSKDRGRRWHGSGGHGCYLKAHKLQARRTDDTHAASCELAQPRLARWGASQWLMTHPCQWNGR